MSPQYHSASCRAMLLFIPLLVTGVGLGGFGGSAADRREVKVYIYMQMTRASFKVVYIRNALGQVSAYKPGHLNASWIAWYDKMWSKEI